MLRSPARHTQKGTEPMPHDNLILPHRPALTVPPNGRPPRPSVKTRGSRLFED